MIAVCQGWMTCFCILCLAVPKKQIDAENAQLRIHRWRVWVSSRSTTRNPKIERINLRRVKQSSNLNKFRIDKHHSGGLLVLSSVAQAKQSASPKPSQSHRISFKLVPSTGRFSMRHLDATRQPIKIAIRDYPSRRPERPAKRPNRPPSEIDRTEQIVRAAAENPPLQRGRCKALAFPCQHCASVNDDMCIFCSRLQDGRDNQV